MLRKEGINKDLSECIYMVQEIADLATENMEDGMRSMSIWDTPYKLMGMLEALK